MRLVYVLLVGHFVADFICQTDWMALNKSKRWDALALHVGVYISVMGMCLVANCLAADHALMAPRILQWWLVNGAAHFVQDAITSRINGRFWFFRREDGIWEQAAFTVTKHGRTLVNPWSVIEGNNRHWFFVGIGADQLLHYVTLLVTAQWWLV